MVPLANCCSAANTAPPHLGHPRPGAALIDVVSGLQKGFACEICSSLQIAIMIKTFVLGYNILNTYVKPSVCKKPEPQAKP